MSMYNMFFGQNPLSDILLATLGLTRNDVGRFRDCYLDGDKIAVYTRNGGGNRKHWDNSYSEYEAGEECPCPGCIIEHKLPEHPNYLYNEDDDFDCTYATIYFSIPDEYKDDLKDISAGKTVKPGEKWQKLFKLLENQK